MAGTFKDELRIEEFEIKEETTSTKREILPSSSIENIKMENTEIQGILNNFTKA